MSPVALLPVPDGQTTFAEQVAPGSVRAVIEAVLPGIAGPGSSTNVTKMLAAVPRDVGAGLGVTVGRGVAVVARGVGVVVVTLGAGVAVALRGMP